MSQEGLGLRFDIGISNAPIDAAAAAITGKRISLRNADAVTFVVIATGASTDTLNPTLSQHTALSGGTTSNLAVIDHFYVKSAATLAGTETWTKVTQAAAASIAALGTASQQLVAAIPVGADQLSDGYGYVSLSFAQGSNATHFTAVVPILHGLRSGRKATNLPASLA
jgi:hypothetical protein